MLYARQEHSAKKNCAPFKLNKSGFIDFALFRMATMQLSSPLLLLLDLLVCPPRSKITTITHSKNAKKEREKLQEVHLT